MSDPVTNVEVEDVLSSIRRLVADDGCPATKTTASETQSPDCLLLTPALRVVGDQFEGEFVSDSATQVWPGYSVGPEEAYTNKVVTSNKDYNGESEDHLSDDTETASVVSYKQSNKDVVEATPEAFTVEAVVDEVALQSGEPSKDIKLGSSKNEAAFFTGHFEALASKLAALEAAIDKPADQREPDGTGDSNCSGTKAPSVKWDKAQDVSVDEALKAESTEQSSVLFPSGEEHSGEEVLFELFNEIVRQELQGVLEERIKRSVREIVRCEVNRILDAQELE